jgi:tetratricopeptide (TPR) repeat protein
MSRSRRVNLYAYSARNVLLRLVHYWVFAMSVVAAPILALAQPNDAGKSGAAPNIDEAKTFFAVGAQAYERGDFLAAIAAFEEAQKRVPRPALLFSIAQAHRRQYYVGKKAEHLVAATRLYRRYLADAPNGPRAADAGQFLTELAPAEERLGGAAARDAVTMKQPTRVSVNASVATNARVSLDGKPAVEAPLIAEVEPGKHRVVVSSAGYIDETRELVAVANSFVAIDISLRESPANLSVDGDSGARIEVDGRLVGTLPLTTPATITPGIHLIAVSHSGSDPYVKELEFSRGETKKLAIKLATSSRRKLSNALFIGGGVATVATLVFAGAALNQEAEAKDLLNTRSTQRPLQTTEREEYERLRGARTTWTTAAIVGGAAAVALGATALVLRLFDDPARNAPSIQSDQVVKPQKRDGRVPLDIGFAPIVTPDHSGTSLFGGASFFGRF